MKKILTLLAITLAALTSCKEELVQYSISVDPTKLSFNSGGGDETVTVASTAEWELYRDDSFWCSASSYSGKGDADIVFTAAPNEDFESSRTATFTFISGDKEATLTVTQEMKEHSINIEPADLAFAVDGGEQELIITSSDEWRISSKPTWIKVSRQSGENGAIITVTAEEYYGRAPLSGEIVFICGDKETKVTVTQKADDSPIIQFKDPRFLSAIKLSYLNARAQDNEGRPLFGEFVFSWYFDFYHGQFDFKFDKNGDGEISENEAVHGTGLQLKDLSYSNQYNIRDMGEIKYFTSLQYLDCDHNDLTTLDLTNNTSLEYLTCRYNSLTTLDVSNCTALKGLDCDHNDLTTLDLSNNTALTTLYCSNNPQLSKIILPKFYMLEDSYIRDIIEEYGNIIEYVE